MNDGSRSDPTLIEMLVGDGGPLLSLTGIGLLFSGCFALFLAAAGNSFPMIWRTWE